MYVTKAGVMTMVKTTGTVTLNIKRNMLTIRYCIFSIFIPQNRTKHVLSNKITLKTAIQYTEILCLKENNFQAPICHKNISTINNLFATVNCSNIWNNIEKNMQN